MMMGTAEKRRIAWQASMPSHPGNARSSRTSDGSMRRTSASTCSPSPHVHAAVDGEVRAGGVTAFVARDPRDDGGDLARLAEALDRDRADDLVEHVLADRLHHVRADVARADGVDRHALAREFL